MMKALIPPLLVISLLASLSAEDTLALNDKANNYGFISLEALMNMTIISSTGTEQKISDAPSIATVITAKQIERSSARTLSEVLAMVPGLNVYTGDEFAKKAYDIRGIASGLNPQILTLINGISIDRFESGTTSMRFTFPASAIKRVEVIRGPGSAVYGADAFSGVINIITKDAKYLQNNSQMGIRYGSFNTAEVYGNYGEVYESGLELGLNLSYMTSDGDTDRIVTSDLQTVLDGIFGTSASLAPAAMATEYEVFNMNMNVNYERFSMNLWTYFQKDNGVGPGGAKVLDHTGKISANHIMGDFNYLTYSSSDLKWNNKLIMSYRDQKSSLNFFGAGATLPVGDDGNFFTPGGGLVTFTDGVIVDPITPEEEKVAFESTLNISKFENQEIRVSTGYSYEAFTTEIARNFGAGILNGTEGTVDGTLTDMTGSPFVYIPDVHRNVFFLSLQDKISFSDNWNLTVGLRYDNYSDFGGTINPRLGLVWNTTDAVTTKLLYGRAFRAPTAGELYYKNNPAIFGNEDLDPETIDMIELGFIYYPTSDFRSSLNLYGYEANDLISLVPAITGIQSKNVGRQHGAGVELEATYQLTQSLLLSADYAYRWTKNGTTKEAVAKVPKHIGHAMIDYNINKNWFINSMVTFAADTPREVGDTRDKVNDYAVVDLSTGYRITNGLEASIAFRNLFDKEYVNASTEHPINDYPMAGLNIFAELRYRF